MTTRSWIGGFNGNDIYAGANWSPAGTPAIGDTLNMRSGIASMSGGNLFGDTLSINTDTSSAQPYSATVDLSGNAALSALVSHTAPVQQQVTFNVVGKATLHLQE
jgi:hypothetical protein